MAATFLLAQAEQLFAHAEQIRQKYPEDKELADGVQAVANELILKHVELDDTGSTLLARRKTEEC